MSANASRLIAGVVLLAGVPEGAPVATAEDRVSVEVERVGRVENMLFPEGRSR